MTTEAIDCSSAEHELERNLGGDSRERAFALEILLRSLLRGIEYSSHSTDGVLLLHERKSRHDYFAVATVCMLPDEIEPASFSIRFSEQGQVVTGRVNFGLMTEHLPRRVNSRSKLQDYLQAFPDEVVRSVRWQFMFERHLEGWLRRPDRETRAAGEHG